MAATTAVRHGDSGPTKRSAKSFLVSAPPLKRAKLAQISDDEEDEDDDDFYGISKQPLLKVTSPTSSPSVHHVESDEDEDDCSKLIKTRKGSIPRKASFSNNNGLSHRRRKSVVVPDSDRQARQRCFDYLVSAIDEVWAQYCDCTTSAENEMYGGDQRPLPPASSLAYPIHDLPSPPVSIYDEENGYSSAESIYEPLQKRAAVSEQPRSVQLMNLKKRLLNAKYFFLDLLDCNDPESSFEFWRRWDLVKYATLELVEEEGDNDETVESVTEELEMGRYYGRF